MSTLSVKTIDTANGSTSLTTRTGNTFGPSVVILPTNQINVSANSTLQVLTINTTAITAAVPVTAANVSVTSTLNVTTAANLGNTVISGTANVSGDIKTYSANVTTSLTLGTPAVAANGHSKLPNGLTMQWGVANILSTGSVVTLPTSLTAAPYQVQLTTKSSTTVYVTGSNTSTFSATSGANGDVYFLVIGV